MGSKVKLEYVSQDIAAGRFWLLLNELEALQDKEEQLFQICWF